MKRLVLGFLCGIVMLTGGIFVLNQHRPREQFASLEALQGYADTHDEFAKSSNDDFEYPDFAHVFSEYKPNFFQRWLQQLGLLSRPTWDPNLFKQLLQELVQERSKRPYVAKKDIQVPIGGHVVLWGDLHGSYHSLVRTLSQLYAMGYINKNLEVIKDNVHCVFLGDTVNRSPYSLETLTVILTFMKKNPDKVIYLQGSQETEGYWENYSMRLQLKSYAANQLNPEDFSIPLSALLNKFFATLPRVLAMYREPEEVRQAIYAAHSADIDKSIITGYEVEVLITGEKKPETVRSSGLEFIGYSYGTVIWSLLSCPSTVFQNFFKFRFDCFAIVQMGENVRKSTIKAYDQDIYKKDGFHTTTYEVMYGIPVKDYDEAVVIHREEPLEVGSTAPLSGGAASTGRAVDKGIGLALGNFNKTIGHDNNFFVRQSVFDDQLVPRLARSNVSIIKSYGADFLITPVGGSTLSSYLDQVKKGEMTVLFPYAGEKKFRDPDLKYIVNLRNSYAHEAAVAVDYMVREYALKKFAFLYQTDEYGTDALEAAHEALRKHNIASWTDIAYSQEQSDLKEQAAALIKADPEAIGLFAISSAVQDLLNEIGSDFFAGKKLFGLSFLESEDLWRFLDTRGIKCTFITVVPDPFNSPLPIVEDYRKAMDSIQAGYNADSLEAYIATRLFVDALEKLKFDAKPDKVIAYLEGLKNYNFGGLNLTFNPKTRGFDLPLWIKTEDKKYILASDYAPEKRPTARKVTP